MPRIMKSSGQWSQFVKTGAYQCAKSKENIKGGKYIKRIQHPVK